MDAMHTTLQAIATLLTSIAQRPAQLHPEATINPQLQSAAEVLTSGITPPLSLITPPLPPTTVETRHEMALGNGQGVNTAVTNSEVTSAQPVAADGETSKRPGLIGGLGKLFYLRS
jgi:hypothetical protein